MKKSLTSIGKAHITIHSFAVAHAITAAIIISHGNDPGTILTILTIAMVVVLTRLNDYPLDVTAALALISCFAGFFLGTAGADLLSNLLSEPKALAQILTTILVTEVLGWLTFVIVAKSAKQN